MIAEGGATPARRFDWERELRGSELPSIAKHVGLTIATYGDADGTNLHPGAALLAQATSTSESTVRRGLRVLVDRGYLIRVAGGRKEPKRARDQADEYRLALPATAGHTDYQSQGLLVTGGPDWWSESTPTGGHTDYPPEPDQIKTSSASRATQAEVSAEVSAEHRDAVAALLARHPGAVTETQAARCAADVARRNRPRDLAKYVRALPLEDVLARAARDPQQADTNCAHGTKNGKHVRGIGANASRICDRCEAEDPAPEQDAVTPPLATTRPAPQLDSLETEVQHA